MVLLRRLVQRETERCERAMVEQVEVDRLTHEARPAVHSGGAARRGPLEPPSTASGAWKASQLVPPK